MKAASVFSFILMYILLLTTSEVHAGTLGTMSPGCGTYFNTVDSPHFQSLGSLNEDVGITQLSARLPASGQDYWLAIYQDDGFGSPGTRLGYASATAPNNGGAETLLSLAISPAIQLRKNTNVWFALSSSAGSPGCSGGLPETRVAKYALGLAHGATPPNPAATNRVDSGAFKVSFDFVPIHYRMPPLAGNAATSSFEATDRRAYRSAGGAVAGISTSATEQDTLQFDPISKAIRRRNNGPGVPVCSFTSSPALTVTTPTTSLATNFAWSCTGGTIASAQCSLDGAPYSPCTTSSSFSQTLSTGIHVMNVRVRTTTSTDAVDLSYKWTIYSDYTWVGAGGDSNWSNGANWKSNSPPGPGNVAIFDETCTSSCSANIGSSISVAGILMSNNYFGGYGNTLTQSSGVTITVGSSGFIVDSGTFIGGDSAITVNGPLMISGTSSFSSTSGVLTVTGSAMTIASTATFNASGGTVDFAPGVTATFIAPNVTFNHLQFTGPASTDITVSGTITVNGNFLVNRSHSSSDIYSGTFNVKGNVTLTAGGVNSNATVRFEGTGAQTWSGSGQAGHVVIASSGTVTLSGTVSVNKTYNYISGTVVATGSTLQLRVASGAAGTTHLSTPGAAIEYNHVRFVGTDRLATIVGPMNVKGNLTIDVSGSSSSSVQGGPIYVEGDLIVLNSTAYATADIHLVGTNNQTWSGSDYVGRITINKTGGILTMSGTVAIKDSFTYIAGNVVTTGSTLIGREANYSATGLALNNLTISIDNSPSSITGVLTVNGNLIVSGTHVNARLNGGTIDLNGDLTVNGTQTAGGSGLIRFVGTGAQTWSGTGYSPQVEFLKPSGTLTLSGNLKSGNSLTNTSGNISTASLTNLTFGGSGAITLGALTLPAASFASSRTVNGTLVVDGNLTLDLTSAVLTGGTIEVTGNVSGVGISGSSTTLLKLVGSSQTWSSRVGPLEIASSGTVTFSGTVRCARDFTHTSGSVVTTGSTLELGGPASATINAPSITFNNVSLIDTGITQTITGSLNVAGNLVVAASTRTLNGGVIRVGGNTTINAAFTGTSSGSLEFNGTGAQTLTVNTSGSAIYLSSVAVNKPSGALTLTTNLNVGQNGSDLTISGGTFDMAGYTLTVNDVLTINSGTTLVRNGGTFTPNTGVKFVNNGTVLP